MAFSAHKSDDDVREFESDIKKIQSQAKALATAIRKSKHFAVFTGAGISTSAGIPDFRGPQGVWTLSAQGKSPSGISSLQALPTATHMALVALERAGYLKYLISQNCDGLHRRSGFPKSKLAELHGNSNLEYCKKCKKEYMRDFSCRRSDNHVHDHDTGRSCKVCGGALLDSIINFGESLPTKPLQDAFQHSQRADLMLVLGSSLRVTPAADMPRKTAERKGELVICNLQRTPLDSQSKLRIFSKCDQLMELVLQELGLDLPKWLLERQVRIFYDVSPQRRGPINLTVTSEEEDGTPASILKGVRVHEPVSKKFIDLTSEPFAADVSSLIGQSGAGNNELLLHLHFMGHYGEPPVALKCAIKEASEVSVVTLKYDVHQKKWSVMF